MSSMQPTPDVIEDLLWCLMNPAYGLARMYEATASSPTMMVSALFLLALLVFSSWRR